VVLHTDIVKGPARPANGGMGALVTIYGANFQAERGSSIVSFGATAVNNYLVWSDRRISVEIPSTLAHGVYPIAVTVGGAVSNRTVKFTVAGNNSAKIYYFDPAAAGDGNETCSSPANGTINSPWRYRNVALSNRSLTYYTSACMADGDLIYVRAGTIDHGDSRGWAAIFTIDWAANKQLAVLAYPGETATLDGNTNRTAESIRQAVRSTAKSRSGVLANFNVIGGYGNVLGFAADYGRVVGNVISGPNACEYEASSVGNGGVLLSNTITGVAANCTTSVKLMHAIYVHCPAANPSHDFEIAYNTISGNRVWNGIQLHDDSAIGVGGCYNASIHDNWISDVRGSGVNLSTVDFPKGAEYVRIYNNVFFRNGAQTAGQPEGWSYHDCIADKGTGRTGATGVIDLYNNTMYACSGAAEYLNSGGVGAVHKTSTQPGVVLRMRNNIIYQPAYRYSSAVNMFCGGANCATAIQGENNIWFGLSAGEPPPGTGARTDPLFRDAAAGDLRLQVHSPARDAGSEIVHPLATDLTGARRRQGRRIDIGAFEFQGGSVMALGRAAWRGRTGGK
jgi:hypothetical protein